MRVTSAWSSSTVTPSSPGAPSAVGASVPAFVAGSAATAIATICWASTSSALRGTTVGSISPSCMRRATTAHSSRSPRNLGKMRPRLTSPTPWPARPMRCRPRATDLGDSICSTRSTAPMSMPSSSELVATRHGSSPALSSSSTLVRSSRASEPWCARAISSGAAPRVGSASATPCACAEASSLRRSATRSAARRLLTNTIVELCSRTSLQQLGVDRRPDRVPCGLAPRDRVERVRRRRVHPDGPRFGHRLDGNLDAQVERLASRPRRGS